MNQAKRAAGAHHGGTGAAFSQNRWRGANSRFGPLAAAAGAAVVIGLLATLVWSAVAGSASPARHPTFFGGSLVLADNRPLISLDVATGTVEVQLAQVSSTVGAESYSQVQPVALDSGTLLVNSATGQFNLLGADNFVVDERSRGIGLGSLAGATGARGVADGTSAFIIRFAPRSTVSLVGPDTVDQVAAGSATSANQVAPIGFISLGGSVPDVADSAAAVGGSLTAVVDERGIDHLERLDPAPGAALSSHPLAILGPAGTPVAVEAVRSSWQASTGAPGEVAVASPGEVRLYPTGGVARSVAVPATRSATALEAVSGATGQAWFLARSASGWSVFGVDTTGRVSAAVPLAIPVTATLAEPAASGGALYTMAQVPAGETAPAISPPAISPPATSPPGTSAPGTSAKAAPSGQPGLWVLDPVHGTVTSVPGFATYPRASTSERPSFVAASVVTRGPRVIFDNPDSLLGVVVFTDGSRPPVAFDKANALTVSPQGPTVIAAPTPSRNGSRGKTSTSKHTVAPKQTEVAPTTTTTVAPSAPVVVNQRVSCTDTAQTPRAPQVAQAVPSAHSVLVRWTYPLLDQQDCEPDSWVVTVRATDAPQPVDPAQTEIGELQYQFAGLRPAVHYQVTVTAYINNQSTTSTALSFTTLATGADPPSSVRTVADKQGNWTVSWTPCRAATCYVPAATWVVTGAACGGFAAQPPTAKVDGSQTSITLNADSLGLLGDSFSFEVQGVSAGGLTGDPTADHSCSQAWQPPNPAAITVAGAGVTSGPSVTATLQVTTTGNPTTAYGSRAVTFTYHVGTANAGPTTATSVKIPGLIPGTVYTPSVTITPTAHPTAAITVTGKPFHQNLAWPTTLAVSAVASVDTDPNHGTIVATFSPALPVAVAVSGNVTCGAGGSSFGIPLQQLNRSQAVVPVDLTEFGGSCSLSATVAEVSTTEYGVASPMVQATFNIGTPIDTSSMSASFLPASTVSDVQVQVAGVPVPDAGSNWVVAVTSPPSCAAVSLSVPAGPPTFPLVLNLGDCADTVAGVEPVNVQPVVVTLSYHYLGEDETTAIAVGGTSPTTTTAPTTTVPPTVSTSTVPPTVSTSTVPPTVSTSTAPPTVTTTTATTTTRGSPTTKKSTPTTRKSTSTTKRAAAAVQFGGPSFNPSARLDDRTATLVPPADNEGELTLGIIGLVAVALAAAGLARIRRQKKTRSRS